MEAMKVVFLFLRSLPKEGTIRRGLSFQLGYNLREGDTAVRLGCLFGLVLLGITLLPDHALAEGTLFRDMANETGFVQAIRMLGYDIIVGSIVLAGAAIYCCRVITQGRRSGP